MVSAMKAKPSDQASAKKTTKKLATATAPTIEAVTGELLRLANEQQAIDWLHMLERSFVVSKFQIDEKTKRKSLILWIKGFDVTPEEKEKGYLGNFAAVAYRQKDAKWVLYPTKIFLDLAQHPQRKYQNNSKHPNWGHPILRNIKKKQVYKTFEAAQAELTKLHEQFPTASIPTKQRLFVMIFSREGDRAKPISKYVLEIKVLPAGGFYIDFKLNQGKKKQENDVKAKKIKKKAETKELIEKLADKPVEPDQQGYFTSMVELKRKRRK